MFRMRIESSFGTLLIKGAPKFEIATGARVSSADANTISNVSYRGSSKPTTFLGVPIDEPPKTLHSLGMIHDLAAFEDPELRRKDPESVYCELRATASVFAALLKWTISPDTTFDHFIVRSLLSQHV